MHSELGGWEHGLSPDTIYSFRQNSPELIIRDAKRMLHLDDDQLEILRRILLARGVNKWFKARRDIIKLKHEIKKRISELLGRYKKWERVHKTELKLLNSFYERLEVICHQPRWVEWPRIADPREAEKKLVVKAR
ncbi:hypothetical protein L0337_12350 [candidate division KSB1 bacterium]|nr:hypothetical protein [candidate division KSB1 bacterium]